jgi:hypothetical protein
MSDVSRKYAAYIVRVDEKNYLIQLPLLQKQKVHVKHRRISVRSHAIALPKTAVLLACTLTF